MTGMLVGIEWRVRHAAELDSTYVHGARLAAEPEGRRGDARRVAATQLGAYLVRDADGQRQLPERVLDHGIGFASTYVSHASCCCCCCHSLW